ncbi:unnamed protein product [Nezara viridula]|uniref:Uncharacterized protein n=1 Tax=Nezara viridula TaxID=85310 RepID=A0A9P0HEA0_NEZVI|nr:unnamed protein product [Nezara viridula]
MRKRTTHGVDESSLVIGRAADTGYIDSSVAGIYRPSRSVMLVTSGWGTPGHIKTSSSYRIRDALHSLI